ncbi:MAG TPA: hypothetical protein VFB04_11310 [Terriglobales bacterium]|nr:hypothetical protein [Terriglobales bacterium]
MASAAKIVQQDSATHAVGKDFCRIFEQDMDRLYLLSLLLTAEHGRAERCFAEGLQDSAHSPGVFREWAHSWARRMIVQNAIQIVRPQPAPSSASNRATGHGTERPEIAAVLALPAFERFVFVMSVLERYSDKECALLLDSTRGEVVEARFRALQAIAAAAESHRSAACSGERVPQEVAGLAMKVESVPLLATLP